MNLTQARDLLCAARASDADWQQEHKFEIADAVGALLRQGFSCSEFDAEVSGLTLTGAMLWEVAKFDNEFWS